MEPSFKTSRRPGTKSLTFFMAASPVLRLIL
jgi:hypothetical protein